ncbi:uncharacterized protein LOC114540917 [Dendronephthya gigantea]|uniref:uncharacterized protein LOC114540917 n=1 Tax=Dendronephthya gigantea TaxID=151771 RepID=UPI00106BDB6D|nr:uncharacterized protein LOC114540917 [Dendronephthya gigantea]
MACSSKTPSRSRDDGFRQLLPWLNGGRSYLQAKQQDFRTVIFPGMLGEQNKAAVEHTSAELVAMAKQALSRAELDIAEKHCSQAVRKQILENRSKEVSWEPHFCLGEVLETKAAKINGNSLEKQRLLLQAGSLYNFVKNCIKKGRAGKDCLIETTKAVSKRLLSIQNNLVLSAEGDPLRCDFDSELDKKEVEELRNEAKEYLESLKQKRSAYDSQEHEKPEKTNKFIERASEIRKLCEGISSKVKRFLSRVISQCVQVLGDPPCNYEVVVLGSLAREEMTPYSDLEWAILISSEEVKCKVFFRNLTNLVHLQIINLGETILPSMGIKALSGEWFYDNVTPRGYPSTDSFHRHARHRWET